MTPLAKEKAFKITGKFSGGIGSSGKWTPTSQTKLGGNRFGNNWEAEAEYRKNEPQPTMKQRLAAAQKKSNLGAEPPKVTVQIPGKKPGFKDQIKKKAQAEVEKRVTALSPRAASEKQRLEGLFSTHARNQSQSTGLAGIAEAILNRAKE